MARRSVNLADLFDQVEDGRIDFRELGDADDDFQEPSPPEGRRRRRHSRLAEAPPEEFIVENASGDSPRVRQAGADAEGLAIAEFKLEAERSLYVFAKAVLGKWWLHPPLHAPLCDWLTDFSKKRRKLCLIPRGHGKTTLVCDTLPAHLVIQSKENNIYFPGLDGSHCRILMACETHNNAQKHIRVLQDVFEANRLLRALWPHKVWPGKPSRHTTSWNKQEMILPRSVPFPEPTIFGCGVDAAITGAHPNVLIKDDMIGFPRCTSVTEMNNTRDWHEASRNLVRGQQHLEWCIGTHWTPADIYVHMKQDPTMEVLVRAAIENGEVIYPIQGEKDDGSQIGFTLEDLRAEQKKNPILYQLNYMNNPSASEIVDFPRSALRFFTLREGIIEFEQDERDLQMAEGSDARTPLADELGKFAVGVPFTPEVQAAFFASLAKDTTVRFRG